MPDTFLQRLSARLRPILPRRFRHDEPVVSIVRLSGAIGM
jgi:hypothetical protein